MAIWRIPKVKSEMGHRSNTSIYTAVRSGLLTSAVQLSKRSVGWPDFEIEAICAARIAGCTELEIRNLVIQLHVNRSSKLLSFSGERK
jgi:prophage regulatory protein